MRLFPRRRVYLDNASATPMLPQVLGAMDAAEHAFANPGAIHADGVEAKKLLEEAREGVAHELGAKAGHIIFTSGLSESNNLAMLGAARRMQLSGKRLENTHWIVSSIEHDSVLACFGEVERLGGKVSFIDPAPDGRILPETLARALRKETVFVSIGWANNEIGVVQPLAELARVIRTHEGKEGDILFHSDAGQGPLYASPQVHTLGVDLFSLGAGKLYGPRSSGALYVRDTSRLAPVILGGKQEKHLRAGTEHVVPAVGFAKALELISLERSSESARLKALRDQLLEGLEAGVPGLIVNGGVKHMLPHMLNVSIPDIASEYVVLALDRDGIAISTKSACREGEESRSHVVLALGKDALFSEWRSKNTLRFSLGRSTTAGDIDRTVRAALGAVSGPGHSSE